MSSVRIGTKMRRIGRCAVTCGALLTAQMAHAGVTPSPSLAVSGPSVDQLGAMAQFTATGAGGASEAVTWQVNGVAGGNAVVGWISASGRYTAPSTVPATNPVKIGAVSVASPSVSATVDLTLKGEASSGSGGPLPVAMATTRPQIVVQPLTSSAHVLTFTQSPSVVRLFGSAQFNTLVTSVGDPHAILGDQHATFEVNGVPYGTAATGTITSAGFYSPPLVVPAVNTVQITAISTSDSSAFATVPLVIENPMPVLLATSIPVAKPDSTGTNILLTVMGDQSFLAGTGFIPSSVILVNNVRVPTTYVAQNQVTANLGPLPGVQTLSVAVMNPDPGGSTSAAQTISVYGTFPSGPSIVRAGATAQFSALVQNPSGPTQNQGVSWLVNGVPYGSAITGTISATGLYTAPNVIPAPGTVTISATSGVWSDWTGVLTLTIENALPVVSSTTTAIQNGPGTGVVLDVIGTGFGMGATINVDGSPVTTTWLSSTELTATVGPETSAASVLISVTNPDPGGAASSALAIPIMRYKASIAAAARLLDQATFGPPLSDPKHLNDIQHVQAIGLSAYLDEQFAATPTYEGSMETVIGTTQAPLETSYQESEWWQATLGADDQLRQRVAYAWSQIFVVSGVTVHPARIVPLQNIFVKEGFGNFRQLLEDVTLSDAMGEYLNMQGSGKPLAGQIANQNFAREAMQLFTIGLVELNQDGTPKLDANGNQTPTFNGTIIDGFARAFTGWTWPNLDGSAPSAWWNWNGNYFGQMQAYEAQHDQAAKPLLNGVTLNPGQSAELDLKDALDNLFHHPNVGPFIGRQLIQKLVSGNPSPAYVARVAAVFDNDGHGVRGNLQAVIRAILLDKEARAGDTNAQAPGGHLRDTLTWTAAVQRGLAYQNVTPAPFASYNYFAEYGDSDFNEVPYLAPSVFGYYPPGYVLPETTMTSPEFSMEDSSTVEGRMSLAKDLVNGSIWWETVDLTATSPLGRLASTPTDLVGALDVIFMHGQMPGYMRSYLIGLLPGISDMSDRVKVAVYLVITSPEYKVVH